MLNAIRVVRIAMIRNNLLSVSYKIVLSVFCIVGQLMSSFSDGGADSLRYFTHQSNMFVLIFFVISIIFIIKDIKHDGVYKVTPHFRVFKGSVIMCISATLLVYNFVLRPRSFVMGSSDASYSVMNTIVHYIVPIMVIFDTILFDNRKNYKILSPILWLIAPLIYLIFTLLGVKLFGVFTDGSLYPYFFLNITKYGIAAVFINILYLSMFFLVLGYAIYFLDRLKFKKSNTS